MSSRVATAAALLCGGLPAVLACAFLLLKIGATVGEPAAPSGWQFALVVAIPASLGVSAALVWRATAVRRRANRRRAQTLVALRGKIRTLRQAEEGWRRAEAQLRLMADNAPVLLVYCDTERCYQFVNRPYAQRFGLEPKDLLGKRIPEVLGERAYERFREHVDAALAGKRVAFEVEIPYEKIGPRRMHCVYESDRDASGRVRGFVATITDMTERVRSEERLRVVVESSPSGLILVDRDGRIILTNTPIERMFGYLAGELLGRPVEVLLPEPYRERHPAHRSLFFADPRARATGGGRDLWGLRKDGSEFPVEVGLKPVELEGGFFVLASVIDITAREQAEATLRESEQRYRLLTDALPHMIWTMRPDLTLEFLNQRASEFTGLTVGQVNAGGWGRLVHPDDLPGMRATVSGPLARGEAHEVEYRFRSRDGTYRWVLSRAVPLKDAAGAVVKWIGATHDIHDHRLAEQNLRQLNATLEKRVAERTEALRESEERFRSAFDDAAIGMALVAPDGRWLQVNRSICELVGYTEEDLLATDFQSITHPDDLDADLSYVRQMLAGTIRTYQMEKRYFHKRGHVVHILLSVSLVRDRAGDPLYFISQIQDITQRKQAELRTATSLREKEILLKEIHHRVKNNLAVMSSLFYLQATYTQDERTLGILHESRDRLRSMALVHESLYQSGSFADLDFAAYARQLCDQLAGTYGLGNGVVRLRTELESVRMSVDRAVPCGLILNELVTNALKHAFPDGRAGEIVVALYRGVYDTCVVRVVDDGVGFPADPDVPADRSLGLRLVRSLSGQVEGRFELLPNQPGIDARLVFKVSDDKN